MSIAEYERRSRAREMAEDGPMVHHLVALPLVANEQHMKPRRLRKPTLAGAIREAKKAGVPVAGATFAVDGSISLAFGEATKTNGNGELDEWMAKHHADSTKGH
jgi:hypothetical protein